MKRIVLIITFLYLSNISFAQTYLSFPDSAVTWVNAQYDWVWLGGGTGSPTKVLNHVDNYCMSGKDTTINAIQYSKLNFCGGNYKGGIRDQNGKVYYVPKDSTTEFLLYDFTLNQGDEVTYYMESPFSNTMMLDKATVGRVDTTQIDGINRRRISLGAGKWIEGIGNTMGLFSEVSDNVSLYARELYCMSLNNNILIENMQVLANSKAGSCPLNVSIKEEIRDDLNLSVYPNPSTGAFTVLLNNNYADYTISVSNMLGEVLIKEKNNSNKIEIDLSGNPQGIYFISFANDKNIITQKIIKL
jgi:hypothetical protein